MKKIIFLLAFAFTSTVFSQDKFEKIDEYLTYLYDNNKFMGSLCLREGENVVFNNAYGFADVENKIEADRTTKYKIGSITKTFTSVMIFQLMEEKNCEWKPDCENFSQKLKNPIVFPFTICCTNEADYPIISITIV